MSAAVTFLVGRADTGKTARILSALANHQQRGERAVLLVPEQYTYEAEKALSDALGGILGIEVLSFSRLNERILTLHGLTKPFLSELGHRMVIRRAALLHEKELVAFARSASSNGFAAEMQEVFSDLKRAGVDPDALAAIVQKLPPHSPLFEKLSDICLLYRETEHFLSTRYLTTDDAANAARALLPVSFLAGLPVYIDGVDRPSAQLFSWLDALLRTAKSVTVSLRYDPTDPPDADVFTPDAAIYTRLLSMAEERSCPVSTVRLTEQAKNRTAPVAHLERNLYAYPTVPYQGEAREITVFGASNRTAEAEALADAVLTAAKSGVRYREMAVIVSDPAAYMPLLSRVLARRGIPVFLDRKRPVTAHAAVDAMLSALRAVSGQYTASDVLRLVKSGYANVPFEDAEVFELYLVRTGLTGSAFKKPFARGEVPEGAERARQTVIAPLLMLAERLHGRTVSEKVRALYEYLVEIQLEEQLRTATEALLTEGRIALMEEHAQVWNSLVALLSELDAILGDVPLARDAFLSLVEEGLSGNEIGVIPGTRDQLLLGDLVRTKSRAVRALFFVGVNEGLLPAVRGDDGLINDRELALLAEAGSPLARTTRERASDDALELYSAVGKARGTVYFGYSFSADGAELSPSPLIRRVLTLFPQCEEKTDLDIPDALPLSEQSGLRTLAADIRAYYAGEPVLPRMPALLKWYGEHPAYRVRTKRMLLAGRLRHTLRPLGHSAMRALYGETIRMSASRLEQFSACPFKHFIRYGLSAEDRREYTEKAIDLGTLYHAALDAFTKQVIADGLDWTTLDEAAVIAILNALLPAILAEHNGGIFLTNDRLRVTLPLLTSTVQKSALAIVRQVAAGAFTPVGSEVHFGEGQAFPPIPLTLPDGTTALLSGTIDRIDEAKAPGKTLLRVVDYKSGKREFDFAGILNGMTLQLPLYLLAAGTDGKRPAGMYYMPIRVPPAEEGEHAAAALMDAFRLRGLTLSDPVIVRASDRDLTEGASSVLKGVKAAGEDAYAGAVCSKTELATLLETAKRVSENAFSNMLAGHIEVAPAERACAYCDYRSVCRFDPAVPGNRTRKFETVKAADFFKLTGGEPDAVDE